MAYMKVETANAIYYMNLSGHPPVEKFVDFIPKKQKLDAIAAEWGGLPTRSNCEKILREMEFHKRKADVFFLDPGVRDWIGSMEMDIADKRYKDIKVTTDFGKKISGPLGALTIGKMIYDLAKSSKGKKITRRKLITYGGVGVVLASIPFIDSFLRTPDLVGARRGEVSTYREIGLKFIDFVTLRGMRYSMRIRNAVVTKRLEEIVAPHLRSRLGRKPVIGIYFGTFHGVDLKKMLKKPTYRKAYVKKILEPQKMPAFKVPTYPHRPNWINEAMLFRWNAGKGGYDAPKIIEGKIISKKIARKLIRPPKRRLAGTREGKITRRQLLKRAFRRA